MESTHCQEANGREKGSVLSTPNLYWEWLTQLFPLLEHTSVETSGEYSGYGCMCLYVSVQAHTHTHKHIILFLKEVNKD